MTRRARTIRIRRWVTSAVALATFVAIVSVPISGLIGFGSEAPNRVAATDDAYLAFGPVEGFTVYSSEGEIPSGGVQSALATNVPLASNFGISADGTRLTDWIFPTDTLETMPAEGVVLTAGIWSDSRNPLLPTEVMPSLALPIDLDVARKDESWEGQPDPDVAQWVIWGTVNGRRINVRVFFGRLDPTPEQRASAQQLLDGLVFPPPPQTTTALDDFGITLSLPDGWEGQLARFAPSDPPKLEASTVPLSAWTDGVPTDALGRDDISFWLEENDGLDVSFEPISLPVTIDDTHRCDECPAVGESDPAAAPGHAFFFRTFDVAGRSFELSVEFGTDDPAPEAIASVNEALSTLSIDDVLPGWTLETIDAGGVSLEAPSDWHSTAYEELTGLRPFLVTSNAVLPEPTRDGLPTDGLGADDVMVSVSGYPSGSLGEFPERSGPPQLGDLCQGCEGGSPATHAIWTDQFTLGGRHLYLRVEFGDLPSPEELEPVAAIVSSLSVSEATTQTITTGGITLEVPIEWDWTTRPRPGIAEHLETSSAEIPAADGTQVLGPEDIHVDVFAYGVRAGPRFPQFTAPLEITHDEVCLGFCEEGSERDDAIWWQTFGVDEQPIGVRVDFGSDPTDEMLARANAVLATLRIGAISESLEVIPVDGDGSAGPQRYEDPRAGISLDIPEGWWAKGDPVPDLSSPPILVAFGNYDFPRGGDCAPTAALDELPPGGVLAWIWEPPSPPDNAGDYAPWPPRISLDAGTPSNYECSGDTPTRRFLFSLADRFFVVQVALGPQGSDPGIPDTARTLVEDALSSFGAVAR